ncbi:hypothetical protein EXIGLDRAFT_840370 [Exidia glandulosa HHB12029]|uniref:Uncharacterized protein n=1 Tax=Exidia glandulosa HHB12029 TaxID=1314781 RepID=A0A165EH91_EXIGL|nr:hypothetical protein EXIGLDRAFT_840370 [Exidia glandulosa HHB12029]
MLSKLTRMSIAGISLDSAGLVALADLSTISERTALTGTSSYLDVFFLAPGIHTQQNASDVNGGELPVTAMTSGYVFRIENQATVFYLQRISAPGHLVEVRVERLKGAAHRKRRPRALIATVLYAAGVGLTIVSFALVVSIHDYWAVAVLGMLVLARVLNVVVMRRRAVKGWTGQSEPGVRGDLLVLLSQDRWVRVQGLVDDLKEVTAGQWIRDMETLERFAVAGATLLVYVAAALAANASTVGSLIIGVLLLVSVALLGLCNAATMDLHMFNCRVCVAEHPPKAYGRRLDMANEMIAAHAGRRDWAVGMGLVLPESGEMSGRAVV